VLSVECWGKAVDNSKFESKRSKPWISVHDIGKTFDGVILGIDEYLRVESGTCMQSRG